MEKINQSSIINFPENSDEAINKILGKYGLIEKQKELIEKIFSKNKMEEKRGEIFQNLPGFKIARLLKDNARGLISLDDMPLRIASDLEISQDTAQKIFNDLNKNIISFIILKKTPLVTHTQSDESTSERITQTTIIKQTDDNQKDDYREQIE